MSRGYSLFFYVLSLFLRYLYFCSMDLTGLNQYCEGNPSGIVKIEYTPLDWVDISSFIPVVTTANNWQYYIVFTSGGWLTAPVLAKSGGWNENQNRSKQGKYYETAAIGILPNMKEEVLIELERMANHLYLLKIEDKDGRPWILGTPEHPFSFSANGTSGEAGSLKNHSIRFAANTLRKAHGFIPVLTP